MQVPIHYAETSDGAKIAYTSSGTGFPLVFAGSVAIAFEQYLKLPGGQAWIDGIRNGRRCVTFNFRGTGLSGPIVGLLTPAELDADLAAVIDATECPQVDLLAMYTAVPIACAYAARNPDRLRSLTLIGAGLTIGPLWLFKGWKEGDYPALVLQTSRSNWDFPTDKELTAYAQESVRSVPYESYVEYDRVTFGVPVDREVAQAIRVPTLCLQAAEGPPMASELAEVIAGATLVVLNVGAFIAGRSAPAVGDALAAWLQSMPRNATPEGSDATLSFPANPRLSPREAVVLRLLATGHTNREIAAELYVSLATVDRHVANLYEKLGVHRRTEAVVAAIGLGLGPQSSTAT